MRQIASARHPAVQRYRRLADASERRATGLAAAEGPKILREALLSDADLVQVFLGERAQRGRENEDLLARLVAGEAAGHWECFAVPAPVLERMAHTERPQGACAVYRPRRHALDDALRGKEPVLILERVADPGNLGLILRTAEAAGVSGVVLTPGSADPHGPKAVRASAGSVFRVPAVRAELETAAAAARAAGYALFATSARRGVEHTSAALGGKVALLLGPEGGGLPERIEERFGALHVPTGRVESLNVAMAAGILLYEARRQRHARR